MSAAHEAMRKKAKSIPPRLIAQNAYGLLWDMPGVATRHEATMAKMMRESERKAGHKGTIIDAKPVKKSPPPRQSAHPPGTREILEWLEAGEKRRNREGAEHLGIPFGRLEKRVAKMLDRGLIKAAPLTKHDRALGARLKITARGCRVLAEMRGE